MVGEKYMLEPLFMQLPNTVSGDGVDVELWTTKVTATGGYDQMPTARATVCMVLPWKDNFSETL